MSLINQNKKKPKISKTSKTVSVNVVKNKTIPIQINSTGSLIAKNKIEVLHIHDLWMLNSAYKANKEFNLPVVSDLHENFVHALDHYRFANTFPGNLLISKKRWERSEIKWTNKADHIITVIEEAVERYKSLGIAEDKISVVANYVNLDSFLSSPIDENIVNKFKLLQCQSSLIIQVIRLVRILLFVFYSHQD